MSLMRANRSKPFVITLAVAFVAFAAYLIFLSRPIVFVEFIGPGRFKVASKLWVQSSVWLDDCNADGFPDLALVMVEVDSGAFLEPFHKLLYSGRDGLLLQHVPLTLPGLVMGRGIVGMNEDTGLLVDAVTLIGKDSVQVRVGNETLGLAYPDRSADLDRFTLDPTDGSIVNFRAIAGVLTAAKVRDGLALFSHSTAADAVSCLQWIQVRNASNQQWALALNTLPDSDGVREGEVHVYSWPDGELLLHRVLQDWMPAEVHYDAASKEFRVLGVRAIDSSDDENVSESAWFVGASGRDELHLPGDSLFGSGSTAFEHIAWTPSMISLRYVRDSLLETEYLECWDVAQSKRIWRHRPPAGVTWEAGEYVFYDWLSDHDEDGVPELGIRLRSGISYVVNGASGDLFRLKGPAQNIDGTQASR